MTREEAIEVIRKNWPDASFTQLREALETLIPELAESEGERIRKALIEGLKNIFSGGEDLVYFNGFTLADVLAYLEKQKEIWGERAKNITANMLTVKQISIFFLNILTWLYSHSKCFLFIP